MSVPYPGGWEGGGGGAGPGCLEPSQIFQNIGEVILE